MAQSDDVYLRLSASMLWSQRHNPAWLEAIEGEQKAAKRARGRAPDTYLRTGGT